MRGAETAKEKGNRNGKIAQIDQMHIFYLQGEWKH